MSNIDNSTEEWFKAVRSNNLARVQFFISQRINVNIVDQAKWSGLHVAAWNGYFEMCKILITNGADIDYSGEGGSTSLSLAAQQGHTAIADMLIRAGCDIRKSSNIDDSHNVTPLHFAAQNGHRDIVTLLIDAGIPFDASMSVRDITGVTPLHLAVQSGHVDVMDILLQAGSDVNTTTRSVYPPDESSV